MNDGPAILPYPSPRRRRTLSLTVRWVTLLSFTAGAIGVPLESLALWGAPGCAKRPGEACRCSAVSRSLGQCCCGRSVNPLKAESASERRLEPKSAFVCSVRPSKASDAPSKSCCATKSISRKTTIVAEKPGATLTIEACGCGPKAPAGLLLLCGDPRVLPSDAELRIAPPMVSHVLRCDQSSTGVRPRPALPPPKFLPA
jgi:hypothetical protein